MSQMPCCRSLSPKSYVMWGKLSSLNFGFLIYKMDTMTMMIIITIYRVYKIYAVIFSISNIGYTQ